MKIAVPVAEENLALHFGHCREFVIFDVDDEGKEIVKSETWPAPPHQPGLLPQWLQEKGANMIIAGGMGARAQSLFEQKNIKVIIGAPREKPEKVVADFMKGTLSTGRNICDH
ncbi:MAG: ATPase [Chitinivibrionales bacterium]|nr:ATPase [Chitinivibrionales bacterium]